MTYPLLMKIGAQTLTLYKITKIVQKYFILNKIILKKILK